MSKKPNKPSEPDKQDPLRAAAEAQLAHALKPKPRPAEELLHELQVYQIELEMQNEALRQAQLTLEESRDRYVDLYEFAPVGYFTLTDKGLISEINLTGSSLLNVERNKLLRQRFGSFVAAEDRDRWNRLFVGVLRRDEQQSCELLLQRGDGSVFHARLDCLRQATDGKQPEVRIALTDITRLRRAEESMHEWQTFVERTTWGMSIGDIDSRIIRLANPAYALMHGYTVEELHNAKADAMYAPESRASLPHCVERVRKDGHHTFECMRLRKDGSTFPAEVEISMTDGVDGKTTSMISVKDITGRKQAEQQQRDLAAHLQAAREEEKASIAREIHDDLGGTLLTLKMETYWLKTELSANKEATPLLDHVEMMSQAIDHAAGIMRNIITGLRPPILDEMGLLAALEWKAAQFQKRSGIRCRVNCIGDKGGLDKLRSISLFRIAQEALSNAAKHSDASSVEIELLHSDEEILMSITDNGRGMAEKSPETQKQETQKQGTPITYGLRGMTERVEQLGGMIGFARPEGGGFSVTVILPLSAEAAGAA